jgi:hypothetical protein
MPNVLFDFRDFEFVHGIFQLPENIYLFRSEDPSIPRDPTMPLFFGDYEVASFYKLPGRELRMYKPKQPIRVLDMRYVQSVLPQLFNISRLSKDALDVIHYTSLVLGLVSYEKQIQMLEAENVPALQPMIQRMRDFAPLPNKPSWVNPIEMRGVRCGITDVDYMIMGFLKKLFNRVVDGIIAPALPSPYHDQCKGDDIRTSHIYQELILFHPEHSLDQVPIPNTPISRFNMQEYINRLMVSQIPETEITSRSLVIQNHQSGGRETTHPVEPRDAMAEQIASGNVKLKRKYDTFMKKATKLANKMKQTQMYLRTYCPTLCTMMSPSIIRL